MKDFLQGEADPLLDPVIKSYYEANLNLVRTIGIKSVQSAELLNEWLIDTYGINVLNKLYRETWKLEEAQWREEPRYWKYYLNLAGEYHPADTVMQITSLDTQTVIDFNKSNLTQHPTTRVAYQYGTRYYQTLVNQFPDQEDLIMGILMPCDIQTAIDAKEGTILRYDTSLVEPWEYSLIKDLEDYIQRHLSRWYVDAFTRIEAYTLMAYYSELYQKLLPTLLNYRDRRRHSYEVHSFHVKMFLKGYMNLDRYYIYMTRAQALYLYRNLPRLVRYVGHDIQFKELIDQLLTVRNIPMLGYDIRQKNEIESNYSPAAVARSELLNEITSVPKIEMIELKELFEKEKVGLYGTADFYDANSEQVIFKVQNHDQAKVQTKDLISQVPDNVGISTMNFEDMVLRHWGFMSSGNLYNATITFKNPRTGTNQSISAKNAFSYMYYLVLSYSSNDLMSDLIKLIGEDNLQQFQTTLATLTAYNEILQKRPLDRIPMFLAQHCVRTPKPTLGNLLAIVPENRRTALTPIAQDLLNNYVALTAIGSIASFYTLCVEVYKNYLYQYNVVSQIENMDDRAYVRNMVYRLYQDKMCLFYANSYNINSFLSDNNLDSYEVAKENLPTLVTNLYEAGTGISINTTGNLKFIVRAMLAIMRTLSSYNVQYVDIINEVDLTTVRFEPNVIYGYMSFEDGSPTGVLHNEVNLPVGVNFMDVEVLIL